MKEVIDKLNQLANDNNHVADLIEKGDELQYYASIPKDRRDNLVKTYRYWSQCLFMAAWLLENEEKSTGRKFVFKPNKPIEPENIEI